MLHLRGGKGSGKWICDHIRGRAINEAELAILNNPADEGLHLIRIVAQVHLCCNKRAKLLAKLLPLSTTIDSIANLRTHDITYVIPRVPGSAAIGPEWEAADITIMLNFVWICSPNTLYIQSICLHSGLV